MMGYYDCRFDTCFKWTVYHQKSDSHIFLWPVLLDHFSVRFTVWGIYGFKLVLFYFTWELKAFYTTYVIHPFIQAFVFLHLSTFYLTLTQFLSNTHTHTESRLRFSPKDTTRNRTILTPDLQPPQKKEEKKRKTRKKLYIFIILVLRWPFKYIFKLLE